MLKIEQTTPVPTGWWAYILAAAIALASVSYLLPNNDWDLLGHLGAAFALGASESESSLMELAYAEAARHMDAESYEDLVSGNAERRVWSSDPESFRQLLPFYAPRILVTGPAYVAAEAGFSPLLAMRVMSSFWAAAALVVGAMAFRSLLPPLSWLVIPVIALFSGLLEVARFEGADAMACFMFVAFSYFYLKGSVWALFVIALMPLTRSDTVIMSCIATLLCFATLPRARLLSVLAGLAAAMVYFAVNAYFDNYGWAKQFYVVNVQYLAYPADVDVTVTPSQYINAFVKGLLLVIYDKSFLGFVIVAVLVSIYAMKDMMASGYKHLLRKPDASLRIYGLSLLCVLFLILHYLAFPHILVRYFAGQYFILFLCALALLRLESTSGRTAY